MHRSDLISQNEGDFVTRQSNCLCNCKDLSGYVIAVICPDNGAADLENRSTPNYQEARSVALAERAFFMPILLFNLLFNIIDKSKHYTSVYPHLLLLK